ncbi:unnamed protein product [Symbiodinium natans]|uniref:Uncharacterized protein n=1 Tax=Symbiodinium natans TaxID=878477 RepID=A0A812V466_9DINO|nr:unnamed protein product [Symbiodinium natans]
MAAEHVYQPVGDPPRGFQARADYPEPLRVYETRGALPNLTCNLKLVCCNRLQSDCGSLAERCDCTEALRNLGPAMGILASAAVPWAFSSGFFWGFLGFWGV